jgi:hypothetical protein
LAVKRASDSTPFVKNSPLFVAGRQFVPIPLHLLIGFQNEKGKFLVPCKTGIETHKPQSGAPGKGSQIGVGPKIPGRLRSIGKILQRTSFSCNCAMVSLFICFMI